jgi:hypothetical protein
MRSSFKTRGYETVGGVGSAESWRWVCCVIVQGCRVITGELRVTVRSPHTKSAEGTYCHPRVRAPFRKHSATRVEQANEANFVHRTGRGYNKARTHSEPCVALVEVCGVCGCVGVVWARNECNKDRCNTCCLR